MVVHAYAKINLCLDVLGKRPDGMHEIATVMQTISLADRLQFAAGPALKLHCRGMRASSDNLILKAARLLQRHAGLECGASIRCEKHIPVAGGLGGGSTDAAATLFALNRLWQAGLSLEALADLGGRLGSDVPFFLRGGTALATGTGTQIEPLIDAPPHWLVLVGSSGVGADKTASVYADLGKTDFGDGSGSVAQVAALRRGVVNYGAVSSSFWGPATRRWPYLTELRERLIQAGALAATVAGSGPSLFALFESRGAAIRGAKAVQVAGISARVCQFVKFGIGGESSRAATTPLSS